MTLKCPMCGKVLHARYGILHCECGWSDPTHYKPAANACRTSKSCIRF